MMRGLRFAVLIAAGLAFGLTALAQLDRLGLGAWGWAFDLCAHFPMHWAVLALAALVPALLLTQWRAAAAAGAALAINVATLAFPPPYASPANLPGGGEMLTIVSANLHGHRKGLPRLAALSNQADLVAVYETFDAPEFEPDRIKAVFRGAVTSQRITHCPDGRHLDYQTLIIARRPIGPVEIVCTARGERAVASFTLAGVRVVAVHTVAPLGPLETQERDNILKLAASKLDTTRPFILMGDLNTTPWVQAYRALPGVRAGDPRLDQTFPVGAGSAGLPIDHILFGGGLALEHYRVGDEVGSDHYPLLATLRAPER